MFIFLIEVKKEVGVGVNCLVIYLVFIVNLVFVYVICNVC